MAVIYTAARPVIFNVRHCPIRLGVPVVKLQRFGGELADLGLVRSATAEVRVHSAAPLFKLYFLNNEEAFFGFYPVVERNVVIKGEPVAIYDLLGKDVPLFHYTLADDESASGAEFLEAGRAWFDSVWNTIAREYSA